MTCVYRCNEKKADRLRKWVNSSSQHHLLMLEDHPTPKLHPHSRIHYFSISSENQDEIFEKIAWKFLFFSLSIEEKKNPILQRFSQIYSQVHLRAFDFTDQGMRLVTNFRAHLSRPTFLANSAYGKFPGVPAILCGGGRSLDAARKELCSLQNKALILSCGVGLEKLHQMGIQPHFAIHVDPDSYHRFTPSEVPFFYQLRSDAQVTAQHQTPFRFLMGSPGNFPLEGFLQSELGITEPFDGGWNAGTTAIALAYLMGCNPIILTGIDFTISKKQLKQLPKDEKKIFSPTGKSQFSRIDWILSDEWIRLFFSQRSQSSWGTLTPDAVRISSSHPISLKDQQWDPDILNKVEAFLQRTATTASSTTQVWEEFCQSMKKCTLLCSQLLQEIERLFPTPPIQDGRYALLEERLSQEVGYRYFLEPLWRYGYHLLKWSFSAEEVALHRILFLQSSCNKFHAL